MIDKDGYIVAAEVKELIGESLAGQEYIRFILNNKTGQKFFRIGIDADFEQERGYDITYWTYEVYRRICYGFRFNICSNDYYKCYSDYIISVFSRQIEKAISAGSTLK